MSAQPVVKRGEQPSEEVACNLCGRRDTRVVLSKRDWDIDYAIVQCSACGLAYVNPRNFAVEHDGYFSGPYLATIEENGRLKSDIQLLYGEILRALDAYLFPGRLLDVGCAMGHFMDFARKHGWEVSGVESSAYAAAWGWDHFRLPIHPVSALKEAYFPADYCDAAVLVEVVEHLPDPRAMLAEVLRILKPGGVICLTTPNFACYRSLLLREEWAPIIPSGHLYYFTRRTLVPLLEAVGFSEAVDLTKAGNFEDDLQFARNSGKLRLDHLEVEHLHQRVLTEDASRVSNGRGEGLVLCARKPMTGWAPKAAFAKGIAQPAVDGKVVQARAGDKDKRIFYVSEGVRHWVISTKWLDKRGIKLPDDLCIVDRLDCFPEGPPLFA